MTARELFSAFFETMNRRDLDATMRLVHPDFVEEYPQSGERIRGPGNLRAILEEYPGGLGQPIGEPTFFGDEDQTPLTPSFLVVRLTASDKSGTGVVRVRYPDGSQWWMITLFEVKDGLIYRQQTFFGQPFEPPGWRAQWVEPIELAEDPSP